MLLKLRKEKVIELLCLNFLQDGSKENSVVFYSYLINKMLSTCFKWLPLKWMK